MFIETQATQSVLQTRTQEGSLPVQGAMAKQIRATQQQYDFTPTQTAGTCQPEHMPALHQAV